MEKDKIVCLLNYLQGFSEAVDLISSMIEEALDEESTTDFEISGVELDPEEHKDMIKELDKLFNSVNKKSKKKGGEE